MRGARLAALSAALLVPAPGLAVDVDDVLDRDLALMASWLPGRYDNQEQVYFEREMEIPADERHERRHLLVRPIEIAGVEGRAFALRAHANDDPEALRFRRIYVLAPDYERGEIRTSLYTPPDAEIVVGGLDVAQEASQAALDADALTPQPECRVRWRRRANQFLGEMRSGGCSTVGSRSGETATIHERYLLTDSELHIETLDAEPALGAYELRKAREFECWMAIERRGGGWFFRRGLPIHDQGGRIWLDTDDSPPRRAGVKMRNVVWPYGPNRPSLVLYAYRAEDPERAVSYAWTEPEGERIGINLRWVQASCALAP